MANAVFRTARPAVIITASIWHIHAVVVIVATLSAFAGHGFGSAQQCGPWAARLGVADRADGLGRVEIISAVSGPCARSRASVDQRAATWRRRGQHARYRRTKHPRQLTECSRVGRVCNPRMGALATVREALGHNPSEAHIASTRRVTSSSM